MVSLDLLKRRGITPEKLKEKLKGKSADEKNPKLKRLRERIRIRRERGIDDNIRDHKLYYALDLALNVPFRQVDQTLITALASKDPSSGEVMEAWNEWNIATEAVFDTITVADPKTGKNIEKTVLDIPTFFQVHVPLCLAYLKIRQAKIMTDRHLSPFLKFEPAFSNSLSRMRTEVLTSRTEVMSRQFGYWEVQDQSVGQMLHYQFAFQVPKEPWYREEQETEDDDAKEDAKDGAGISGEKKKRKTRITKEGIRYEIPHPTRVFWDKAHRVTTFNTDTGCEFFGYWRALRWKDIANNEDYWNLDKVTIGDTAWWSNANTFFNTVYSSCTIKSPIDWKLSNLHDREENFATYCYGGDQEECPVVFTEYYEKLVPSECGLGDYDYPIWMRFLLAGGDDTIIYAEPFPYCPVVYYGLDTDQNRDLNPSLTLQILPWQDHFSNLMSQFILTTKQNLTNCTFVDTDALNDGAINRLKNLGNKLWCALNFEPFSSKKYFRREAAVDKVFYNVDFTKTDTNQLLLAMKTILDTVERVLLFSSQELGQAASHELRAEEVQNISRATSVRLKYTDIPVANATEAWKKQIFYGLMSEGEEEFYAEIPMENTIGKEDLEKLGFTYDDEERPSRRIADKKAVVKASKESLRPLLYEGFTSSRDADDRTNNTALAGSMLQALAPLLQNPDVMQRISEQVIPLLNEIFRLAGFPRDFKLEDRSANKTQLSPAEAQQLMQAVQEFQQKMTEEMKPVVDTVQKTAQAQGQVEGAVKELAQRVVPMEQVVKRLVALIAQSQQRLTTTTTTNEDPGRIDPTTGQPINGAPQIMA